jgi:hypothetical protein
LVQAGKSQVSRNQTWLSRFPFANDIWSHLLSEGENHELHVYVFRQEDAFLSFFHH